MTWCEEVFVLPMLVLDHFHDGVDHTSTKTVAQEGPRVQDLHHSKGIPKDLQQDLFCAARKRSRVELVKLVHQTFGFRSKTTRGPLVLLCFPFTCLGCAFIYIFFCDWHCWKGMERLWTTNKSWCLMFFLVKDATANGSCAARIFLWSEDPGDLESSRSCARLGV